MVDWHLGTMGFGYKDWNGAFYPIGLETQNYLAYYSRIFNAVEVDSTFYGTPRQSVVRRWVAITPQDFKFCVKTPQTITHNLGGTRSISDMALFLDAVKEFGEKLGIVLIQFPPSFRFSQFNILSNFLLGVSSDIKVANIIRFAVEFRNSSWYDSGNEIRALFKELGICWAATEYPGLPREIYPIMPYLYIRWIGQHGSYFRHDHEYVDRTTQLGWWWNHLKTHLDQVSEIFGFFNNDYAGHAPASCNRFKRIAGIPIQAVQTAHQGKLF